MPRQKKNLPKDLTESCAQNYKEFRIGLVIRKWWVVATGNVKNHMEKLGGLKIFVVVAVFFYVRFFGFYFVDFLAVSNCREVF